MPDQIRVDISPTPSPPLRALILEDDPWDAELVLVTLRRATPGLQAEVLNSSALFKQRLEESEFDIIVADYNLGGWTALDALEILRQSGKSIPLVVVTGALGDEAAVECVRQGAADYVLKDRLERVPIAVDRAVRRKVYLDEVARRQEQIRRAKEEWELTFNTVPDPVLLLDDQYRIRYANRATATLAGVELEELNGKTCYEALHGLTHPHPDCPRPCMVETGREQRVDLVDKKLGRVFETTTTPLFEPSGKMRGSIEVLHEITERKQAEDSLRQLSSQLLVALDEERRRIAQDLHDSTAQNLAALSMNLARLEIQVDCLDPASRIIVSESIELANRCMQEIRDFSYLLHPPTLEEYGLAPALKGYVEGFARRTGIQVNVDLPQNLRRLPREAETALFRIVQECLANIQRHSGSPVAKIRIRRQPDSLILEVEDEGRGFQPAPPKDGSMGSRIGLGLKGMKERVRLLGGCLEINSSSHGTIIRAGLPIPEAIR
jgi:PAS domain S-box-containing protein